MVWFLTILIKIVSSEKKILLLLTHQLPNMLLGKRRIKITRICCEKSTFCFYHFMFCSIWTKIVYYRTKKGFQIKNFSLRKDQKDYVGKSLDLVVAALICKVSKEYCSVIFRHDNSEMCVCIYLFLWFKLFTEGLTQFRHQYRIPF